MKMRGADAILRSLEAEGVEVMFGIPGGAIMPTYDAMARGTTVRHVLARHEQGAGHMAQGYARASGKVGVAIATSGPGATNLVTPIADAWMDSTPLVCITGQVRSTLIGTDAFQECDITGITMPIVKHSWLVLDPRDIPSAIKEAFHIARTGRCGPVLVDIPRDVQEAEFNYVHPDRLDLPGWRPPTKVHPLQIRQAGEVIAKAEHPVLYVGGGTLNADACDELLELAEAGTLPVITTLMGKGAFPETHDLHFGWPGMHGTKWANIAMNTCDVLVAVGARFDDRVTGKLSAFAPGATVVHLDIDAAEISKLRAADIPVVGPLKKALHELAREVAKHREKGAPPPEAWLRRIEENREEFPLRYSSKKSGLLKPQWVVEQFQELISGDDVIVTTGVGQHQMWAMQYVLTERPRNFITSGGLGTMGYGIPAAIGAKAARPEATVVCIDGDGCFQMTSQELVTAVLDDLPIVVLLLNNGYLGMVTQWQDMFFDGRHSHVHLTQAVPDYAKLRVNEDSNTIALIGTVAQIQRIERLINGLDRWCLWFVGAELEELEKSPLLRARLEEVRTRRAASTKAATRRGAATPHLFEERRQPTTDYLGIPQTFTENRSHATAGHLGSDVVASIKLFTSPDPDGFLFAVISSSMFLTWQLTVGGRMKSDPSFTNTIVWNTLPLPEVDEALRSEIVEAGKRILAVRAETPDASLGQQYEPTAMRPELVAAHRHLDALVCRAFGAEANLARFEDRQRLLFECYDKLTAGLLASGSVRKKMSRRR